MNYFSHLAVAKSLLTAYKPGVPLHVYLKAYFKQNKKHGSKDRKLISALCFNFFRLGHAVKNISLEEKILAGFFLCEDTNAEFLKSFKPEWYSEAGSPLAEKIAIGNWQREIENIFPFSDVLSNGMDSKKLGFSFLHQPKLFIRIRPGFEEAVVQKLQASLISYEIVFRDCIALPNSSKINDIVDLDKEAVVQDLNSQRIGEFIKMAINNRQSKPMVWDCCAASGGKSILAYDINSSIRLTVSDKRKSILQNLQQRFTKAGIKNYHSSVADLSGRDAKSDLNHRNYDLIIADVPCTGSGTWARTPEQLFYFDKSQIKKYSNLQKQIVENAAHHLKPGAYFLYITCSVFKKENEDIVEFIKEKLKLNLLKTELLKGYERQADTMFAALFEMSDET